MKFSRLKNISSIEDNHLEAATGGVVWKKTPLNFATFTGIFIYFEKNLRTAASHYSFTLVIHLFFGCLFKKNYDLLIFYSEENVYWD